MDKIKDPYFWLHYPIKFLHTIIQSLPASGQKGYDWEQQQFPPTGSTVISHTVSQPLPYVPLTYNLPNSLSSPYQTYSSSNNVSGHQPK